MSHHEELAIVADAYVIVPATVGPILLLLIALMVTNIPSSRRFPEIWL